MRYEECPMCKKSSEFIHTESPKGFYICGNCGFRTSFGKLKMIIDEYGYRFEEIKTIEQVQLVRA